MAGVVLGSVNWLGGGAEEGERSGGEDRHTWTFQCSSLLGRGVPVRIAGIEPKEETALDVQIGCAHKYIAACIVPGREVLVQIHVGVFCPHASLRVFVKSRCVHACSYTTNNFTNKQAGKQANTATRTGTERHRDTETKTWKH